MLTMHLKLLMHPNGYVGFASALNIFSQSLLLLIPLARLTQICKSTLSQPLQVMTFMQRQSQLALRKKRRNFCITSVAPTIFLWSDAESFHEAADGTSSYESTHGVHLFLFNSPFLTVNTHLCTIKARKQPLQVHTVVFLHTYSTFKQTHLLQSNCYFNLSHQCDLCTVKLLHL